MSIAKVGFHFFMQPPNNVIKQLKKAEGYALNNTMDACTKLFLTYNYPKALVICHKGIVSAFPYSPQLGQVEYLGWLKFNTRKNSYAQKNGSLLCIETESGGKQIELWKHGQELQALEFSSQKKTPCSEVAQFCILVKSILDSCIDLPDQDSQADFSSIEKAFKFPLFYPEDWAGKYKLVEETQLMRIVHPY